ncbi:MAG: NAD/NADP octopine/nopaline dehydrogenase family protein [Peptococcaceae bacterium]
MDNTKVAVIGAGHGGTAMAAHLSLLGADVNLCDLFPEYIKSIQETGGIYLEGTCGSSFVRLNQVTENIREAISGVALIMVVTPAFTHRLIAEACHSCLADGQVIVLNPGRTGGALEFLKYLSERNVQKDITIAETQTLIYACRKTGPAQAAIYGLKKRVDVACIPAVNLERVLKMLNQFFPQFAGAEHVIYTSLSNIGAVFHPAPVLLNVGRIETPRQTFKYYTEGISRTVAEVLEKIDQERVEVAAGLGVSIKRAAEWLRETYCVEGKNLYQLIQNNPAYREIIGPDKVDVRYITEDVPMGLVPISELARKAGVKTPVIDSIIEMANIVYGQNFRENGRTLARLGLDKVALEKIIAYCKSGIA